MRILYIIMAALVLGQSSSAQVITTMSGSGAAEWGFRGDGGLAVFARYNNPRGMVIDDTGNLYICDAGNQRIRKIDRYGYVSTICGTGIAGREGDGLPAIKAKINGPTGITVDGKGNLYFADRNNHVVRKISPDGIISNFAGTSVPGYSGDTGLAVNARLTYPFAVAADKNGNIYISDAGNNRVRMVDTAGYIYTVAGNGVKSGSVEDAPALASSFDEPKGIACDKDGNVVVVTTNSIRKIDRTTGIAHLIAGSGLGGFSGDGGKAINSRFALPAGLTIDKFGNIFIADYNNNRVRMIDTNGNLRTIAGRSSPATSGDGDKAEKSAVNRPYGLATDAKGNLYISDYDNNIRFVFMGELATWPSKVYPNPCNEHCTIMLESEYEELATLFVLDATGATINTIVAPTNRPIRISLPVEGVYVLSGTSKHANWVSRVVSYRN